MYKTNPADELADVRAAIARLTLRHSALRTLLLNMPPDERQGRWHRVDVVEGSVLAFDAQLLPPSIRDDPRYWHEKVTTSLDCLPVVTDVFRAGWPIQRDTRQVAVR